MNREEAEQGFDTMRRELGETDWKLTLELLSQDACLARAEHSSKRCYVTYTFIGTYWAYLSAAPGTAPSASAYASTPLQAIEKAEQEIREQIKRLEGMLSVVTPDLHRKRASKIFTVPYSEVTPEQRQWVKVRSFHLIYGLMPGGLGPDSKLMKYDETEVVEFLTRLWNSEQNEVKK